MPKQTIRDLNLKGRKVLVRVDFNVPQKVDGTISDDRRIKAALPTLNHVLDAGGSLILVSHLGRPIGDPLTDEVYRLDQVAVRLSELLGRPVAKINDTVGSGAHAAAASLQPGEVVLLENVRFNEGEKKGDPEFAKQLAALADVYVNDAFGTCHRDEASMVALPRQFLAQDRGIGFLVEKELEILDTLLKHPKSPMVAIMGGAKVSDKIGVIENLLPRIDKLLIGGAMTYTFLKAQGHTIGKSRVEADKLIEAQKLLEMAGPKLVLPIDHLMTETLNPDSRTWIVAGSDLPDDGIGIDIGPETVKMYNEILATAGTVVWNGPMGKFEDEPFRQGTLGIAQGMASSPGITVVGGGETAEAVEKFGFADQVTHVSTGGGAFLECLEGKKFNSLAAIADR